MKWIILIAVLSLIPRTETPASERWWDVIEEKGEIHFAGGRLGSEDLRIQEVTQQTEFDEWIDYEDEFVQFSYPKHPLIKLEINEGDGDIEVEGGVCTFVDNSFSRAYVLSAGDATFQVMLLNPADWLDDGICMCGPMIHDVYQMREGCLVRYSLLPSGAVKKAQILGQKLRFMAFEWTHLACQKPVYEKMVESMRVKLPLDESEENLHAEISRRYGLDGVIGFFHQGDPKEKLIAELGEPTRSSEDRTELIWEREYRDHLCTFNAHFTEEGLQHFGSRPINYPAEPLANTLAWASWAAKIEFGERSISDGEKRPPYSQEKIETILEATAPSKDTLPNRYYQWASLARLLIENEEVDSSVYLDVVMDQLRGEWFEPQLIEAAEPPIEAAWYRKHFDRLMSPSGNSIALIEQSLEGIMLASDLLSNAGEFAPEVFRSTITKLESRDDAKSLLFLLGLLNGGDIEAHQKQILRKISEMKKEPDESILEVIFVDLSRSFPFADLQVSDSEKIRTELLELENDVPENLLEWYAKLIAPPEEGNEE